MTEEEKKLLLQDLCARLPYGVKVCVGTQYDIDNDITDIALLQGLEFDNPTFGVKVLVCVKTYSGSNTFGTDIEDIKPYLRPISSITEEEWKEFDWFVKQEPDEILRFKNTLNFYNKHHIDYIGLIPMGLAIEAPEGMYN